MTEKKNNNYNYSLCPNKCTYDNYDNITKKVSCKCNIQTESSNLLIDDILTKDKLLNNFKDIKSISNLGIIHCFKESISKDKLKSNIGSYILMMIMLLFIIFLVSFYAKGYKTLFDKMKLIIENKRQNQNLKENEKNEIKNTDIAEIKNKSYQIIKMNKKKKKKKKKIKSLINTNQSSYLTIQERNDNLNIKTKKNENYIDSELNSFPYEEAVKNDKRTFWEYYASLIKTKHILISAFFKADFNSNVIKISLFFYSFGLLYFTNSLFFTDATMHKIYEDGGIFNLAYSIPQICYSFIITAVINSLIRFLSLSDNEIIKIKQEKDYEKAKEKSIQIKRCLKIKYVLFFIVSFISLSFFWCYLACFGSIYKNTQLYLLKDTLISFGVSLIYPFFIYLIPSSLRIMVLKRPKYIYKFSKLMQSL